MSLRFDVSPLVQLDVHDHDSCYLQYLEVGSQTPINCLEFGLKPSRSDILDVRIDAYATRTAVRPLPSGRCSMTVAILWFLFQLTASTVAVYTLLGRTVSYAILPAYFMATIYPFAKRWMPWPQFVLAPAVAWPVVTGCISAASLAPNSLGRDPSPTKVLTQLDLSICVPLFLAYASWTIYFDTAYGLQDIVGDRESGIGSLAQYLGKRYIRGFLLLVGMGIIILLGFGATNARCSPIFWIFGIGIWACSILHQLYILDADDPSTGGRVFGINIVLGLFVTVVTITEVFIAVSWPSGMF
jgi:4-hydroxybenzoate polyprenyltransferase